MAENTISDWLNATDEQEKQQIIGDIAGTIDLGLLKVSNLVRDVGDYLNEDATLIDSAKGMEFLAAVLTHLEAEIGRNEIHTVVEYLCARLENKDNIPNYSAGIKDTAISLQALSNMKTKFPKGDAAIVAQAVFAIGVDTRRNQTPSTRLALFNLVDTLLDVYSPVLIRDMARKFITGVVSMADFEKDPSSLTVLFKMYEQISQKWSLDGESCEEIWDSYSRYFPIKVGGTAASSSKPAVEELRSLLLKCFISNDTYAQWVFPMLIDRLDKTQTVTDNVKREILNTLVSCVSSYESATVLKWFSKIWDALKFEVWHAESEDTLNGSLDVIQEMVRSLNNDVWDLADDDNTMARLIIGVTNECNERFLDSKERSSKELSTPPSGLIISKIAETCPYSFYLVTKTVLPVLFKIWRDIRAENTSRTANAAILFGTIDLLLQARLKVGENVRQSDFKLIESFSVFQQRLVEVYFAAMSEAMENSPGDESFHSVTIQGLSKLARIPNLLTGDEKGKIHDSLSSIALDSKRDGIVRSRAIKSLQQMSMDDPARFRDITLAKFMTEVPEYVSSDEAQRKRELNSAVLTLQTLMVIACGETCKAEFAEGAPPNAKTSFKFRAFDEFQGVLLRKLIGGILKHENQLPYATAILATMYRGIETFDRLLDLDMAAGDKVQLRDSSVHPYSDIVIALYQRIVTQKPHTRDRLADTGLCYMGLRNVANENEVFDDKFIGLVGRIATASLRSNLTTPQNNFVFNAEDHSSEKSSPIWTLFYKDSLQDNIGVSQQNLQFGPAEKCSTNILSMSLLAGLRIEEKHRLGLKIGDVAANMIGNAVSVESESSFSARISMLWFLQLLVNKFGAAQEQLTNDHRTVTQVMINLVESCQPKNSVEALLTYQTLAYFTAAALACFDNATESLVTLMIGGIANPSIGRKVAQSFKILLAPSEIMSEENFCAVRPLRKNRLFELTINKLTNLWRETSDKHMKSNYLVAIASILGYIQPSLLKRRVTDVLPLVLEGTNVDDEGTKIACMDVLMVLIQESTSSVEEHFDSVTKRMTHQIHNNINHATGPTYQCRVKALEVLTLLATHVRPEILMQRKTKIMADLMVAVGDSSREVRHLAERCKMLLFNLAEGDGN